MALKSFCDPRVEVTSCLAEQGAICRILDQRMLEDVSGVRRLAAAEDELGRDQIIESGCQALWRLRGM